MKNKSFVLIVFMSLAVFSAAVFAVQVDRVHINPDLINLSIDDVFQFTAEARGINNDPIVPTPSIVWSIKDNDTTIGNIDSNGLFTAIANGTVSIVATIDGINGTANIVIGIVNNCQISADTDGNSIISNLEILNYVRAWKTGSVTNANMLAAIGFWKSGTGC